jgi:SAM-dependent MidA family methyltransferase
MEMTPGLRRAPAPTPEADWPPPSDPILLDQIRDEIRGSGPMTFARFMELALYDPDHGYYRRARPAAGREGDFLTAPEAHPLFGATLARPVAEAWRALDRPSAFALVEYGAGSGALAAALLDGLRDEEPDLLETLTYLPIEIGEARLSELHDRLAAAGLAHVLRDGPAPTTGVAIANEYLDALPVHLVEQRGGALVEIHVGLGPDDRLREESHPPSTPALADRLAAEGITLADGQRAEVCLAIDEWADDLSGRLERGLALVIDYGAEATDLYGPSRPAGTLMAYAGHRAHDDPLVAIGRQDLTAHVDLTAVRRALETRGWRPLELTSQSAFLVEAGMEAALARHRERATDLEAQLALRSAVGRLLDPRATGGFRVLRAKRGEASIGLARTAAPRAGG